MCFGLPKKLKEKKWKNSVSFRHINFSKVATIYQEINGCILFGQGVDETRKVRYGMTRFLFWFSTFSPDQWDNGRVNCLNTLPATAFWLSTQFFIFFKHLTPIWPVSWLPPRGYPPYWYRIMCGRRPCTLPSPQGSTPTLPNFVIFLLCSLHAFSLSRPSSLVWKGEDHRTKKAQTYTTKMVLC